jgi:large subunit ribosomal protein L10
LRKERKLELSENLSKQLENTVAIMVLDYTGLTVQQMEDIRNSIKEIGATFNVIKNSVVEKAVEDTKWDTLKEHLKGTNVYALSFDDPAALAKALVAKAKEHKKLEIKVGSLDGSIVNAKQIEALSKLPPKEVLIAQLLGTMNAPVTGFVNVLAGNIRKLMYVLKAIEEKKGNE